MIELNKKYRVKAEGWAPVELWQGDADYVFGRVGCYPMSWSRITGLVDEIPTSIAPLRDELALIEVLPEVTVRQYIHRNKSSGLLALSHDEACNECWETIGAANITHNGKEIIDVKVVK